MNDHSTKNKDAISSNGMAATSHPLATEEAIKILKKGGNAVDAAIAASVVLSVVEPNATSIGGDCFAIIKMEDKKPVSYNGSGIAPEKANYEFFKKNNIDTIGLTSPHSVTVPGALDAWKNIHNDFGKLDFEELFLAAINFAKNGFEVTKIVSNAWNKNLSKLSQNKNSKNVFLNNGKSYQLSDLRKNIPLGNTLELISKKGVNEFYEGSIANDMVKSLNELGGLHTLEDFSKQKTIKSKTISSEYKNIQIHQCPPNGPGITVLLMMKLLEKLEINKFNSNSVERFHLEAEVTKQAFKVKEENLADPNFVNVNLDKILSDEFINNIYESISLNKCSDIGDLNIPNHPETVYLSVVDKDLNTVSVINSVCYAFGSGITTDKTGIILHNRGTNFRVEEEHPNCIEGLKRPLHTIIPGMVLDHNGLSSLSYGVMGGQYQPVGQVHVLNNILDFEMS
ncbi:gamma-glutamyltransferase family protein, partial [Candidatus Pelagibacter sp.]|nr:gamma-glutamyltransferase family protein [Candidatus Pelagibacter sp.]